MGTVTLTLGDTTVEIDAGDVDNTDTWPRVMHRLLIPALAGHGYFVELLYSVDELGDLSPL